MAFKPLTKELWARVNADLRTCVREGKERPTVAAVVRRRGKYLIVTSTNGTGGGYFNLGLVKGGAEKGETALRALLREIRQELRIRRPLLKIRAYCGAYSVASIKKKNGFSTKRYFVFHVVYCGPQKLRINGELSGYYWMTLAEVEKALHILLPERQEKYDALSDIFSSFKMVTRRAKQPPRP